MKEFIDATIFLGMHSKSENRRIACKNYFIERMDNKIWMNLEAVGKCDDVIWSYSRKLQDLYYPFMDRLHSVMKITRIPYSDKDMQAQHSDPILKQVSPMQRRAVAMSIAREGTLYSYSTYPKGLPTRKPELGKELKFPGDLEKHYKTSLELRI